MCRERPCFSSFKYSLGTWSLCPGPESKVQVVLAGQTLASHPCHWVVLVLVLIVLLASAQLWYRAVP